MFGGPAYGDRRGRRRGRWLVRLASFVVALACVGGVGYALAPPELKAQAAGLVKQFSITKRLEARGAFPRPRIQSATADVCPEGMALVADRFCMDRYEASTVLIDENGKVIGPHSPYEMLENKRVRAESRPGVHPQGYISRNQA